MQRTQRNYSSIVSSSVVSLASPSQSSSTAHAQFEQCPQWLRRQHRASVEGEDQPIPTVVFPEASDVGPTGIRAPTKSAWRRNQAKPNLQSGQLWSGMWAHSLMGWGAAILFAKLFAKLFGTSRPPSLPPPPRLWNV